MMKRVIITVAVLPVLMAMSCIAYAAPQAAEVINRIVAVVNDDVITEIELQTQMHTIKQQLRQQNIRIPPDSALKKQVLERLIISRIQLQMAASGGIRVDDDTLNKTISNIASQNKMTLSEFRDVLQKDGFEFAQFRENIRDEIIMQRLRQRQVDSRISISDQEIANFMANQNSQGNPNDQYRLGHILIAIPEAATPAQIRQARQEAQEVLDKLNQGADFSQIAITVSDGQQALSGGDLGWRKRNELPGLFSEVIDRMSMGGLSDIIRSSSGFHIIKLLGQRGSEPHIVSQTMARHILLRPNELVSSDEVLAQLTDIRQRIGEGEDFATLAREHSDDKASAINDGSLGWVNPGVMVPEFEKVMNSLEPGQVSEPFKTGFGWHIVEVLERRDHDDTEEYNKAKVREIIYQRKQEEGQMTWIRRIRGEAYVEIRLDV